MASEGEQFVQDVVLFFVFCVVVLLFIISVDCLLKRRMRHGEGQGAQSKGGGLLMMERMHWLVRGTFGTLVLMLLIIPVCVIAVCLLFGPLVAALEGWSAVSGIEFLMGSLLGLANPLTAVAPDTAEGSLVVYVFNLWGLLITTAAMGVVAQMSLITTINAAMPDTLAGFVRFVLLYVPACLTLVAILTSVPMALAEGWSFGDGFFYMAGTIALAPLTDVVPQTSLGCLVEVICTCFELAVGGALIGIIGAAPLTVKVIAYIEGGDDGAGGDGGGDSAAVPDGGSTSASDGAAGDLLGGPGGAKLPEGGATAAAAGGGGEGEGVEATRARLRGELEEATAKVRRLTQALESLPSPPPGAGDGRALMLSGTAQTISM